MPKNNAGRRRCSWRRATTILPTPIPHLGADVLERSLEATDSRIANGDLVRHPGKELLGLNEILEARRRNSVRYAMNGLVGLTPCLPYRHPLSGNLPPPPLPPPRSPPAPPHTTSHSSPT